VAPWWRAARWRGMGGVMDLTTNDLERAKKFAKSQDPKKYLIATSGPTTYDCSGFMASIHHVLRGKTGNARFKRLFGTGNMGSVLPTLGYKRGKGDANDFTIGWATKKEMKRKSKYGHTVGSLGGLNVECRGGKGVLIGSAARSPSDKMFKHHMHLPILAAPSLPPRPAPKPFPGTTIKKDATGPNVRLIQAALNIGGAGIKETGTFDGPTIKHVKLFQAHRQLPGTGEVDKTTWDRLMAFLRPPKLALHRVGKVGQTLNLRVQAKRFAKKYFKSDKPNAVEVMLRELVRHNPDLAGSTTIPGGFPLKVPTRR
jgi:hypothetical protein